MRPSVLLDRAIVRANFLAWQQAAGVPLRAVVKSDGYGWGARHIVRAVDDVVGGYFVADVDEYVAVRSLTSKPIATLADVGVADVGRVLDAGGIPNVSTLDGIDAAQRWMARSGRPGRVRLGIRSAAAWAGIGPGDVVPVSRRLAAAGCDVEVWTHVTDPSLATEQRAALDGAVAVFRAAGVRVVGVDLAATGSLAEDRSGETGARIGVGLFGFRCGAPVDALRSAISVRAAVLRREPSSGQFVGYGTARAPETGELAVARCGYGDGFPRVAERFADILAVGMQYTVVHGTVAGNASEVVLIGPETNLDALALAARTSPHELVVRLGRGAPIEVM